MPEQMADYFDIATRWETASAADRSRLKTFIAGLVGYKCKVACEANHGSVDIFVLSERTGDIQDFLEIQRTGAIGVVFEQYEDHGSRVVESLNNACEDYNESIGAEFVSDSEDEVDSDYDVEEEAETTKEKKE
jgi:hypothetical protein